MTSWILEDAGSLNPEQFAIAEGLAEILDRLDPPHVDVAASTAVSDVHGFHVTLVHSVRPELTVGVIAGGDGEVVVSYGLEHEHFRAGDAADGRLWPFPSSDHIEAVVALVEGLLTGRIELRVRRRPLVVHTRSYWINEAGHAELFLRGGTLVPQLRWSRTPEVYRFDFT